MSLQISRLELDAGESLLGALKVLVGVLKTDLQIGDLTHKVEDLGVNILDLVVETLDLTETGGEGRDFLLQVQEAADDGADLDLGEDEGLAVAAAVDAEGSEFPADFSEIARAERWTDVFLDVAGWHNNGFGV